MEKLLAEATKLETQRAREQADLLAIDMREKAQERNIQIEARRRSEMEQREKLIQGQEERYNQLLDQQMEKQQRAAQRLQQVAEKRARAQAEKKASYQAKVEQMQAKMVAIELNNAADAGAKSFSPRRSKTPGSRRPHSSSRGSPRTSPRMRSSSGMSAGRHDMIASRRLEEEKQALLRRIAREKERIERIQREKQTRKDEAKQRRANRADAVASRDDGEDSGNDDDGAAEPEPKARTKRRALTPRKKRPERKREPKKLTREEAERLGFIKKQRCAVCAREYILENLPAVVSYRAVERLREGWCDQFGTKLGKDARYAAATKLYDQVRVCVFCFQFFDPDQDERGGSTSRR
eukprot:COSAG05_NODE_2213_length_3383_cov_9.085871_1_plen_351_part_00